MSRNLVIGLALIVVGILLMLFVGLVGLIVGIILILGGAAALWMGWQRNRHAAT